MEKYRSWYKKEKWLKMNNVPELLKEQAERLEQYYQRYYPAAAAMAKPCFLNTAETTLNWLEDGTCFVITGDIPAMWLRDSAAQVRLYARFAADSEELRKIIRGVIAEQAKLVLIDPYANAFNRGELDPNPGHVDDDTVMNGYLGTKI